MYLEIENIIKSKLSELTLVDENLKVITEGKAETPYIYISLNDTTITETNETENFGIGIENNDLAVTIFYDFKVKKDKKEHMYNWIRLIQNKIRELEQTTITTTDYYLNILKYRITNIAPRYESEQEGFLIMTINVNLQQIWR